MKGVVIFDFDGVLLDSFTDQYKWFLKISRALGKGFGYNTIEAFREDYREPVYPAMYEFLGLEWDKNKDIIWKEFNEHKANAEMLLFPGIDNLLYRLSKQKRLAIASSNTQAIINKQLETHDAKHYFEVIVAKDDLPVENGEPMLKPNPACINITLDRLNCGVEDAIYVGDQPSDIIAAKRVAEEKGKAMKVVAVTYGYCSAKKLLKTDPDFVAHDPQELLRILME